MTDCGKHLAAGCNPDLESNNHDSIFLEKIECAFVTELCLSPFSSRMAVQFLKSRMSREGASTTFKRVIGFVLDIVNKTSRKKEKFIDSSIDWQSGCPNVIRNLRASPFWNTVEFPWIKNLEEASPSISMELMGLRGLHSFQPYRAPVMDTAPSSSSQPPKGTDTIESDSLGALATTSGEWNVCYLHLHDIDVGDTLKRCPVTAAAIESIPRHYHHAFFSALSPTTHVAKHHGSTNKKLRCHLPLKVPKGAEGDPPPCWLRVGSETVPVEEGVAIVFDDSFEHEAANDHSLEPRVVLVVDFWHPDFTDEEVKFLEYISKGQMATLRSMESGSGSTARLPLNKEAENFLDVIKRARQASHTVQEKAVWGATE